MKRYTPFRYWLLLLSFFLQADGAAHAAKMDDFLYAVRYNELDVAKKMLEADPKLINETSTQEVDFHPVSNWTALHQLAKYGYSDHMKLAMFLIAKGANVNALDSLGETPMHLAAQIGETDAGDFLTLLLYYSGASPSGRNKAGQTPLDIAIWMHSEVRVDFLSRMSGEINDPNASGVTPIQAAALDGDGGQRGERIIDILLENGAKYDLFVAVAKSDTNRIVATLRAHHEQAKLKAGGTTLAEAAIRHNNIPLAKLLMAAGSSLSKNSATRLLAYAVYRNNKSTASFLLDSGANPNTLAVATYGPRTLLATVQDKDMRALLIRHGAKESLPKETAGHD